MISYKQIVHLKSHIPSCPWFLFCIHGNMKKILLIIFIASVSYVHAQDETVKKLQADATRTIKKDEKDTVNKVWKKGGLFSLNLAQASLTNWAAGGEDYSLSINALLSTYLFYKKGLN